MLSALPGNLVNIEYCTEAGWSACLVLTVGGFILVADRGYTPVLTWYQQEVAKRTVIREDKSQLTPDNTTDR